MKWSTCTRTSNGYLASDSHGNPKWYPSSRAGCRYGFTVGI